MKKKTKILPLICALLLFWNVFITLKVFTLENEQGPNTNTNITNEVTNATLNLETDITKVVEKVQNKVVSIITVDRNGETLGSGSGVIYKNQNNKVNIITNHHVIENGSNIIVRTFDGSEYEANLIGSDMYSDLALLQVEEDLDIEPFAIGDSSNSSVGEFVIAIGSPMGVEFENSVTFGIISGKDRLIEVDINGDGVGDWDMVVLQTDAAINPGNSGGALVDMAGQLVGINSLKISSSNVEGMGFSIPINEVIPIINQIEETGKVNYPTIGISAVSISDLNQYELSYYQITDAQPGVYILDVVSQSAASIAGLKKGDIITGFDGTTITNFKEFRKQLYNKHPKDVVVLDILRNGETMSVEVTLQ